LVQALDAYVSHSRASAPLGLPPVTVGRRQLARDMIDGPRQDGATLSRITDYATTGAAGSSFNYLVGAGEDRF
jgi:hypothetical protein